jgi:Domain of unknown function (DUF4340)
MSSRKRLPFAIVTFALLLTGIWSSVHRANRQADLGGGGLVFADVTNALGDIDTVRLSKGDGSRLTLQRTPGGWTVVERQYAADSGRVRELLLGVANLKIVEQKTSDPANYSKLGVEAPESPTAASTLLEVIAGKKAWSLIVGKSVEGRAIYVRKPADAASALAEPSLVVDPDQKRWIDRLLTDIPGANVHDISVKPATGNAYRLSRAQRGDADLVLSPIPKGRESVTAMSLDAQADTLQAFHLDDVRVVPTPAPAATDHAVYRTFDGQVFEFAGRRSADKAIVTITASRDATLAAQFPEAPAPAATPLTPAAKPAAVTPAAAPAAPKDATAERLGVRAKGVEYEIPVYKYDSLFKTQEELLEKLPGPTKKKSAK